MAASKVFIVTGASKGIGAAIARCLLEHPDTKLVLAARSRSKLETVRQAHLGRVEFVAGDLTSPDNPRQLHDVAVQSFGGITGVVICHGLLDPQRIRDFSMDRWQYLYDVNVFSCLATVKASLPELRKSHGCVVWISSGAVHKPYAGWASYCSSKAAANSISANLAFEEEITSIAISPGRVNTDMQALVRASGQEVMDRSQYESFVQAFEKNELFAPEQPGQVIAKFVLQPQKDLSGRFVAWNGPELAAYQA